MKDYHGTPQHLEKLRMYTTRPARGRAGLTGSDKVHYVNQARHESLPLLIRPAMSPNWPSRSKRRKIYGKDTDQKLHLLAIILATQVSMKNQGVMMTQFQRFLATLASGSSRRVLHHGFANKLAYYQVIVLKGVSLHKMVLQ